MTKSKEAALECGFCGKSKDEVEFLVAGPVMICNECVDLCVHFIKEAREKKRASHPTAAIAEAVDIDALEKECLEHIKKVVETFGNIYPCRLSVRLTLEKILSGRTSKPEPVPGLDEAIGLYGPGKSILCNGSSLNELIVKSELFFALMEAARRYQAMMKGE